MNGKLTLYANKEFRKEFGKRRLDTLVWNIFALELWHRVCGEGDNGFFQTNKTNKPKLNPWGQGWGRTSFGFIGM